MKKKLSSVQIIAIGFFVMILIGTLVLLLPFSSYRKVTFLEALFTATSASCVTGLVVTDTAITFTPFGQAALLVLIQTGGLGFMTIAVLFMRLLRKRIGLREKETFTQSLNSTNLNGVPSTVIFIVKGTFIVEGIGALLLSLRFVPLLGAGKGIWYAVFHSVSAFCNAGFDLMGTVSGPYSSLSLFADDWLVNLTLISLIVLGGLGFFVWADIYRNGAGIRKWQFHTKTVIFVNAALIVFGTLLFYILENGGTFPERLLHALFGAVTPRTAGFNTVDTARLSGGGKLLTIFLMFIGGSPGSTAGGAKTTTVFVLLLFAIAKARRSRSVTVFRRSIDTGALEKATAVFFYGLTLVVSGALLILIIQPLPMDDVIFETFSAIGTVGMSTGITRSLLPASRIVVIMLMYLGRVGSTSFAVALLEHKARPLIDYPPGNLPIG